MVAPLSISFDQKALLRALGGRKDQLRFAMSFAINKAGQAARKEATAGLKAYLDKPTPFTTGSRGAKPVFLDASTKSRLLATVRISDLQWKYLRFQVQGGVRTPTRKRIVVPVAAKRNAYGNMPRSRTGIVLEWETAPKKGHRSVFYGTPRGRAGAQPGVYQRIEKGKAKGSLKMLAAFKPSVRYRKKYPFDMLVSNAVRRHWPLAIEAAVKKALATAR